MSSKYMIEKKEIALASFPVSHGNIIIYHVVI